jgi:putative Holliday junction resolvase
MHNELPRKGRLLGIDPGTKTLGLAITDTSQMLVQPLSTIKRAKWSQDAQALQKVIADQEITGIVIGYPRNADGSEGPRCQAVRGMVRNLESVTDLPVRLQDERYSTGVAEELLTGRDKKASGRLDAAAAAIILQDYLTSLTR